MTSAPSTPGQLAAAMGYDAPPVEWRVTSDSPVAPERFGKDHYSTLLYVEHCAVDRHGFLDPDKMRTDSTRHPTFWAAQKTQRGREAFVGGATSQTKYPTRLFGGVELADHDDYDCVDDLLAAGWMHVTMPHVEESMADPSAYPGGIFVDSRGKPVPFGPRPADGLIGADLVTGLSELWLCVRATWGLTDIGRAVTTALRKHKEEGGTYVTFQLPENI